MPIHQIQPTKSIVAYTWCGVDPHRKGVQAQWPGGTPEADCKACLRAEAQAAKAAKVRRPVKVTKLPSLAAPKMSPLSQAIEALIDKYGIEEVLTDIRYSVYGRIDGKGPWDDIYEILVDTTRRVRDKVRPKEGP
jgi:hypothetical protein